MYLRALRDKVVGASCATSANCGAQQTCIPASALMNDLFLLGTCTTEPQSSPRYRRDLAGKYKRSLRVGQPGVQDTRAVIRGRQALTPRQFRTRAQAAAALA